MLARVFPYRVTKERADAWCRSISVTGSSNEGDFAKIASSRYAFPENGNTVHVADLSVVRIETRYTTQCTNRV